MSILVNCENFEIIIVTLLLEIFCVLCKMKRRVIKCNCQTPGPGLGQSLISLSHILRSKISRHNHYNHRTTHPSTNRLPVTQSYQISLVQNKNASEGGEGFISKGFDNFFVICQGFTFCVRQLPENETLIIDNI